MSERHTFSVLGLHDQIVVLGSSVWNILCSCFVFIANSKRVHIVSFGGVQIVRLT